MKAARAAVWSYLVDAGLRDEWWPELRLEAGLGGAIAQGTLSDAPGDAEGAGSGDAAVGPGIEGAVDVWVEGHALGFTWRRAGEERSTAVLLTLRSQFGDTGVTITETGFDALIAPAERAAEAQRLWPELLERLAEAAVGAEAVDPAETGADTAGDTPDAVDTAAEDTAEDTAGDASGGDGARSAALADAASAGAEGGRAAAADAASADGFDVDENDETVAIVLPGPPEPVALVLPGPPEESGEATGAAGAVTTEAAAAGAVTTEAAAGALEPAPLELDGEIDADAVDASEEEVVEVDPEPGVGDHLELDTAEVPVVDRAGVVCQAADDGSGEPEEPDFDTLIRGQ